MKTGLGLMFLVLSAVSLVSMLITGSKEGAANAYREGSEELRTLLGWTSFPLITPRTEGQLLRGAAISSPILLDESLISRFVAAARAEKLTAPSEVNLTVDVSQWPVFVQQLAAESNLPLADFVAMSRKADAILGDASDPRHAAAVTVSEEIRIDTDRPGEGANRSLSDTCLRIVSAYSIGVAPEFGYIQGMADLCMLLRGIGPLDEISAFQGLIVLTEVVSQLNVNGRRDVFDRFNLLSQLYGHMFSEMHSSDLLGLIADGFAHCSLDPIEMIGRSFGVFSTYAGARGTGMPAAIRLQLGNFILRTGRPGLIALWFAGLELNESVLRAHIAANDLLPIHHLLHDPLGAGSGTTVEALITRAFEIMNRQIGQVSFKTAVRTLDALGTG